MIEIQVRADLNDARITALVSKDKALRPNIHLLHAPELTPGPYIEYEILADSGNLFYEGEVRESSVNIQVDIYTYGEYMTLRDAVKEVLIEKGYLYPSVGGFQSFYEGETKLFHCVLRFTKEY